MPKVAQKLVLKILIKFVLLNLFESKYIKKAKALTNNTKRNIPYIVNAILEISSVKYLEISSQSITTQINIKLSLLNYLLQVSIYI